MSHVSRRTLAILAGIGMVGLAACGGGSSSGGGSPTTPSGTLTENFSSIQSQVFNTRCISCHGSARREQNLDLQNNAYTNLVNRQSTQTNLPLVAPGNPEGSYLIHKLDGRAGIVGTRMPQSGAFLSASEIDIIKRWIQNGAANN